MFQMVRPSVPPKIPGEILRSVSRSFYLTLAVLPANVREQVGLAYLLARAAVTLADTDLIPRDVRLKHLGLFREWVLNPQSKDTTLNDIKEVLAPLQEHQAVIPDGLEHPTRAGEVRQREQSQLERQQIPKPEPDRGDPQGPPDRRPYVVWQLVSEQALPADVGLVNRAVPATDDDCVDVRRVGKHRSAQVAFDFAGRAHLRLTRVTTGFAQCPTLP